MHKWGSQGTERLSSPLLSPPIPLHPLKKNRKQNKTKRLNSSSIKPWLSEGKPSTATLPGVPLQGLSPPLAMVTTPGASSKPYSSSTSTGRVHEPIHPGGGLWPPGSSAQDLRYFREEVLCIICGYIS